jgi:2-methylcitrate dehydratase PrpD
MTLPALGRWVAELNIATIPPGALLAAKYQVANIVAALFASGRDPSIASVLGGQPIGSGPSTILFTGVKTDPACAAFHNAAFSMAQDFDDIIWMGHTSHSAVFAALAVGQAQASSTADILVAIVAANEVAARLGASCFFGPLNGQMWTFVHLLGAAAATAKLLKLDAVQTAHAMAIALAQPPFALQPGFFTPTSKYLAAAIPTQIGVQSGYFATSGMTGALDILEAPNGFWSRFSFLPLPGMLEGLGELWVIQTLTIKTVPACHYFQTASEAATALLRRREFKLDDVVSIRAATTKLGFEVTHFALRHSNAERPLLSPVGAAFDLGVTLAIVLTARGHGGDHATALWMEQHRAEITQWYQKIAVVHDPALTMKVIESARGLRAGQAALANLSVGKLLQLVRAYRAEYGSTLFDLSEIRGWIAAANDSRKRPQLPHKLGEPLPLYFPNRVEITFRDGTVMKQQFDLPSGSIAAGNMLQHLEQKFATEVGRSLGVDRAALGFSVVCAAEQHSLDAVIAAISAPNTSATAL